VRCRYLLNLNHIPPFIFYSPFVQGHAPVEAFEELSAQTTMVSPLHPRVFNATLNRDCYLQRDTGTSSRLAGDRRGGHERKDTRVEQAMNTTVPLFPPILSNCTAATAQATALRPNCATLTPMPGRSLTQV
jgi:hypothetical protein